MSPLIAVVLVAILAAAVLVAIAGDALVATVAFAAYSLGLAVLWVLFRAPDVALTEAAVGAGVTTALFLAALASTTRPTGDRPAALDVSWAPVVAIVAVAGALLATVPALPPIGRAAPSATGGAATFYLDRTAGLGFENVVTAVLVVYRGLDTLGEVAVVFAAGTAVLLALRTGVGR